MPQRLTSSQIQTRLETDIARHPACRSFRVEVKVRRLQHRLASYGDWGADFFAVGEAPGRPACANALQEILDTARDTCAMSLDS